jgi:SOS-response transcriptional repressor LexA
VRHHVSASAATDDRRAIDGDFVVVEDRKTADNGEMVIALLRV